MNELFETIILISLYKYTLIGKHGERESIALYFPSSKSHLKNDVNPGYESTKSTKNSVHNKNTIQLLFYLNQKPLIQISRVLHQALSAWFLLEAMIPTTSDGKPQEALCTFSYVCKTA